MVKKLTSFLISLFLFFLMARSVFAAVPRKYVVIVNPVREKNFWKSTDSVERQIEIMEENHVPSTWLLQYSVIKNSQASGLFNNLTPQYEIGVLLEVNEELANDSYVPYLKGSGDWARADKVLLSGYKPEERRRIIDRIFEKYEQVFGRFPEVIGAWYIDTSSLNYLVGKYGIKAVVEVADQYQTDSYGVWGKPWGVPYFPSKYNSIIPAKDARDRLGIVTIQWAVRDPVLGYGLTVSDSTYSVQANDYINHHGLDIDYFARIADSYLNSPNKLTQLTIGLEAGQEGALFLNELERQIITIKETVKDSLFVTMTDFADIFRKASKEETPIFYLKGDDQYGRDMTGYWFSTPFYRAFFLKKGRLFSIDDLRIYDDAVIFDDVFEKDQKERLFRELPACIDQLKLKNQKIIAEDLNKVELTRKENGLELILTGRENSIQRLVLLPDSIYFEGKIVVEGLKKKNIKEKLEKGFLDNVYDFRLISDHTFTGGVRYSSLNGQSYLGWVKDAEFLIGITAKFPYFGIFRFPFQTLSYFKRLPKINFAKLVIDNFVSESEVCTINL